MLFAAFGIRASSAFGFQYLCVNSGIGCISFSGYAGTSTWGYPVDGNGNNCTNYAAFRVRANGLGNPGNLGNAGSWAGNAQAKGFKVNQTPAVGAIAQWDYGSAYAPGFGHVAYVEQVTSTGIVETESNWDGPSRRVAINRSDRYWPSHFIHFKDVSGPPPPVSGPAPPPSFLSPGAINRYATAGDHWVTGGGTPGAGYGFESTLGFAALDPAPNERMLYGCAAGSDHFVSLEPGCEGRTSIGPIGPVYTQPPPAGLQVVGLYRCTVKANGDHFVSQDPSCEGQHTEALLGYATASQDRFNRYVVGGDHVDTARAVSAGATLESTLGFLSPTGGAGLKAIYSCVTGNDQFTSSDPGCEGRFTIGLDGWLYTSPGSGWPQTSPIYRCTVNGNGDHFVSPDPKCEGQHSESLIGYLAQTHAALDRFENTTTGEHWITTRAVPNGYRFTGRLGYLLQGPGAGRHALYSCLIGSDQFTDTDAGCAGQRIIGLDGWAYDSPPTGQQVTAIYRCTVKGSGEHFVSADPGCEGQHTEFSLGYIAATLATAYVPPAPTVISLPRVSGHAVVGSTLSAVAGSWTGFPTSSSYQWTRCDRRGNSCYAVVGATGPSYRLASRDVGLTIRVREWAANTGGTGGPATSSPTRVVASVRHSRACVVPRLAHLTLAQAKRTLAHAHCKLGKVSRPRKVPSHHVLRVTGQSPSPGHRHRSGYRINITLGI